MTQIDTSGFVEPLYSGPTCAPVVYWDDLTSFAQGYVEALFADAVVALRRDVEDRVQMNLEDLGFRRLAPETLAQIIADCEGPIHFSGGNERATGRNFWNRRQACGSPFPPLTVHISDDGKVRFAA